MEKRHVPDGLDWAIGRKEGNGREGRKEEREGIASQLSTQRGQYTARKQNDTNQTRRYML